jgi:hypothetical protein
VLYDSKLTGRRWHNAKVRASFAPFVSQAMRLNAAIIAVTTAPSAIMAIQCVVGDAFYDAKDKLMGTRPFRISDMPAHQSCSKTVGQCNDPKLTGRCTGFPNAEYFKSFNTVETDCEAFLTSKGPKMLASSLYHVCSIKDLDLAPEGYATELDKD